MIATILQIVLFQTIFLAIYDLFLKKETFFNWNRAYLLVTPFMAMVIPFLKMPVVSNEVVSKYAFVSLPEIFINSTSVAQTTQSFDYMVFVFFVGVTITTVLFIVKATQIYMLISKNQKVQKEDYTLVLLSDSRRAFSFLNYVFIGKNLLEKQRTQILQHELVHCKSKHSIDLLIFELLKIVFWFNPIIYLYQYRMQLLHEYIADEKTIKNTTKEIYFNELLSEVFEVASISFTNQFYKSSFLKKRIIMATKNKSKQVKKVKYLMVLPLVFLMAFCTSCVDAKKKKTEEKVEIVQGKELKNLKVVQGHEIKKESVEEVEEVVPFNTIKKTPVFPGCKGNEKELRKCVQKKISEYINKNFNTELTQSLGLEKGIKRIAVMFTISKDGTIKDIKCRAPHKDLKAEAIRVIKSLPKMTPGENERGEKVGVTYTLPIAFKVE
ncbi:MAG: energy transducer TonB [Flavobacteriaceae bacterium]|nr:energy transducer TonB [Flavobacteriaceae bacterium]